MQSDTYSMAEKILRDIEAVITRDVEEFVIIPVTLNQNKSPVIYVENNLGLESWCVKHVYGYAYKKILDVRKLITKRKLLHDDYANVNRLILGVLLINPDISTFWNMRREMVCDKYLTIPFELKVSRIVLSHKSKSNEAFAYRKWLLSKLLTEETAKKSVLFQLLSEELNVCNATAQKSANNYHSWCHRTWCLENILRNSSDEFKESVLLSELCYTEIWTSKHVSEHTGFYYRQYIINKLKNTNVSLDKKYSECFLQFFPNSQPVTGLLDLLGPSHHQRTDSELISLYKYLIVLIYELIFISDLNNLFTEHETLWNHRRFIIYELLSLIYSYFGLSIINTTNLNLLLAKDKKENNVVDNALIRDNGEKCAKILKRERDFVHSSKLYQFLLGYEKTLIDKCSKLSNRHGYLAQRHEKWLVYIVGV